jgi:hypothetical protein
VLAGGLVLAWLGATLPNLRPPPPQDQLNYLQAAANFPKGITDPDAPPGADVTHQVLRFGITLPTRLAIEVFGYSQAAYYAVPLLAGALLLVSVFVIGSLLFSRTVGIAGAALVMASTPIFREQTYLMPDLFSSALFSAVVALCVAVRLGRLPRSRTVLIVIGALLGWSYMAREYIVFAWPMVPILLWRRGAWRDLLWVAVPAAALWALETTLCWTLFHDPLLRVKAITGHGSVLSSAENADTYRNRPHAFYVKRLPEALKTYAEGRLLLGLLGLTIVGGFVHMAARLWRFRDPATRIFRGPTGQGLALLFAWFVLFWVPLTVLGGVLDPSHPKLRLILIRYWYPIFPAFVLGGLGTVWLLGRFALGTFLRQRLLLDRLGLGRLTSDRRSAGRRVAAALPGLAVIAVALLAVTTSLTHSWALIGTRAGGATQMEDFRTWMSRYEKTPEGGSVAAVWADRSTDGVLRVFRSGPFGGHAWSTPIRSWHPDGPLPQAGDLVVVFGYNRSSRCRFCKNAMTTLMANSPPRMSTPVFTSSDRQLYVYRVIGPPPRPTSH